MKALKSASVTILLALVILVNAEGAQAQSLVVTYVDAAETGFFDPTPTVSPITGQPSTRGADRRAAFVHATQVWSRYLALAVDVTIQVQFSSMGGTALSAPLGSAGPNAIERNFLGAPRWNTWYSIAQANQLAGSDGTPSAADIVGFFNADLDGPLVLGDTSWYYGVDGQPGDDVDFVTVALHELCHGLGFVAMVQPNGNWYLGYEDIFSIQLRDNGAVGLDLIEMTGEQRAAALVGEALEWKGPAVVAAHGGPATMYAPTTFLAGSSVSHWDTSHFPNLLMQPFFTGPFLTVTLEWEALADLGWPLKAGEELIVAWGSNRSGQLEVPAPNAHFAAVAAGANNSFGLKATGAIVAWGKNDYGLREVPAPNTGFTAVAAGWDHALGLKASGAVFAWGSNAHEQCDVPAPNASFIAVAAGGAFSLGLKGDGSVVAWGDGGSGQNAIPPPNAGFASLTAGAAHALGLKTDGTIVAWGLNDQGQCDVPAPNTDFVGIAAGAHHNLGLKSNGAIVAWGRNDEGQCDVPEPNAGFAMIAAGEHHSLALSAAGSLTAWGGNEEGQCDVPSLNTGFAAVSAGLAHSLAIRTYPPQGIADPPPPQQDGDSEPPAAPTIVAVAPNPFNPRTTVTYDVPRAGEVDVQVYDARGRLTRTLMRGHTAAGRYRVDWDGRADDGTTLSAGLYLIRLVTSGGHARAAKVMLLK